jgi:hypothetical protein
MSAVDPEPSVHGEGEVLWPEGRLLDSMATHWQRLLGCSSAGLYTQGTTFEKFARRWGGGGGAPVTQQQQQQLAFVTQTSVNPSELG